MHSKPSTYRLRLEFRKLQLEEQRILCTFLGSFHRLSSLVFLLLELLLLHWLLLPCFPHLSCSFSPSLAFEFVQLLLLPFRLPSSWASCLEEPIFLTKYRILRMSYVSRLLSFCSLLLSFLSFGLFLFRFFFSSSLQTQFPQ